MLLSKLRSISEDTYINNILFYKNKHNTTGLFVASFNSRIKHIKLMFSFLNKREIINQINLKTGYRFTSSNFSRVKEHLKIFKLLIENNNFDFSAMLNVKLENKFMEIRLMEK